VGSQLVSSASLGSDDTTSPTQYNVGIGIADNTGPAAEIGMMGYAKAGQNTGGIHPGYFPGPSSSRVPLERGLSSFQSTQE